MLLFAFLVAPSKYSLVLISGFLWDIENNLALRSYNALLAAIEFCRVSTSCRKCYPCGFALLKNA